MRKFLTFTATSLTLLLLVGCGDGKGIFEITRQGQDVYLLNKYTGTTWIVEDGALTEVKNSTKAVIQSAKQWAPFKINPLKNTSFELKTKHIEGELLWIVRATPPDDELDAARKKTTAEVTITFYDTDGFQIQGSSGDAIVLGISQGRRIIDAEGKVVAIEWRGSLPIDPSRYRRLARLAMRWSGF